MHETVLGVVEVVTVTVTVRGNSLIRSNIQVGIKEDWLEQTDNQTNYNNQEQQTK